MYLTFLGIHAVCVIRMNNPHKAMRLMVNCNAQLVVTRAAPFTPSNGIPYALETGVEQINFNVHEKLFSIVSGRTEYNCHLGENTLRSRACNFGYLKSLQKYVLKIKIIINK